MSHRSFRDVRNLSDSLNARQGFFEHADFEAVAVALPPDYGDAARFAYITGWRRGEILPLRWEAVHRSPGEIRLRTSKNGHGRVLFHDLRRTAVRNMVRAGVPQSVAMSISGHRTVSMFMRYNISSPPTPISGKPFAASRSTSQSGPRPRTS